MNYKVENIDESSPVVIAELRLLNAIYLNPKLFIEQGVEVNALVHETTKDTFLAMQELNKEGIPLTANAIYQRASGKNINITLNGINAFIDINKEPVQNINDILTTLRDTNKTIEALKDIEDLKKSINENPLRSKDFDDKVRDMLYTIEGKLLSVDNKPRIQNMSQLTSDYLKIFEERKNGKKYLFNDVILDKAVTYGPAPGCGGLIAAATGMGKSAFCLNLINNFINKEIPCMYFSLEMGKADTLDRLMALRLGIPMKKIVNPNPEEWITIKEKIEKEKIKLDLNEVFRFSEAASINLGQIKQDIMKFQVDIGTPYCICVFDLLSMVKEFMNADSNSVNFATVIEIAINKLNALSKELGIHYIAVLQMNRKGEEGASGVMDLDDIQKFKPTRNGIKNSGAFLERVRYALGLFRPKYYAEEYIEEKELWEDMDDYCFAYMLKQNQGNVGSIGKWLFDPEIMKMTPVIEEINSAEED